MSGSQSYPPPGGGPSEPPPPGWQPQAPPRTPTWVPSPDHPAARRPRSGRPGMLGAAHKPGAMPLRPLGLGDIYDAAFRIIRFNPKATVGSAVLVAAVAMAIPVLVTAVLSAVGRPLRSTRGRADRHPELVGLLGRHRRVGLGAALQYVGMIFVTGMIAHVTAAAAIGRRLSLGEAWAATRGKRWRLLGLALLVGLVCGGR